MRMKTVALLRKRADITHEAFVDYYETRHAPLILSLLPGIVEYRRNFSRFEGAYVNETAAPFDFDVVTEIWFEDRAAYDRAMAVAAQPDIAHRIADDEANLFDRSGTRLFVVDERASVIAESGG